ncbi:nucleotidyltransferase family protein [Bordetella avium]|uniref:MobA-like NTP transferase domain-containing protein n=1 Tax=Bordetella avium (strain 197N) TaxID=360910 RepID=Q2KTJ5_BORA1|nr:nucleotidyltransferase family protein [Bordetella avium]AZY50721.1 nucleotidyltransferase family protein [Bordetella avium]AZY54118.1 nucleotidyltransferase family protein [Bordetella avium]RIQ20092.1 nucleotidyltransferase family protein [Bordetella avium]RIQ34672.1 nucleotidyltransferase family protein [Bordetella avium]RIQ55845.1 nucleotidyltransferase family protein [Bordetella avium]
MYPTETSNFIVVKKRFGILLAGGQGSRFLAQRPGENKLLAQLSDGRLLAQASAMNLRSAVDEVVAVVRPGCDALTSLLRDEGCEVVVSDDAVLGMGASLAVAARHLMQRVAPAVVLVALADMPWIAAATYKQVLDVEAMIAAPVFAGQRGHPVAFDAVLLPQLAELSGDAGARELIRRLGLREVWVEDPGVLRDVDVPKDVV